MENKGNTQQKKTWITPELIDESIEETEGKQFFPYAETPSQGPSSAGPS